MGKRPFFEGHTNWGAGGRSWRVAVTGRWSDGKLESERTSVVWAASEGVRRKMWSRAPAKPCGLTHVGASARGRRRRIPRRVSVGRTRSQREAGVTGRCETQRQLAFRSPVRTTTLAGVRRRYGYTQSRISWRVSRFPSAGRYTLAWQWVTSAMVKCVTRALPDGWALWLVTTRSGVL